MKNKHFTRAEMTAGCRQLYNECDGLIKATIKAKLSLLPKIHDSLDPLHNVSSSISCLNKKLERCVELGDTAEAEVLLEDCELTYKQIHKDFKAAKKRLSGNLIKITDTVFDIIKIQL